MRAIARPAFVVLGLTAAKAAPGAAQSACPTGAAAAARTTILSGSETLSADEVFIRSSLTVHPTPWRDLAPSEGFESEGVSWDALRGGVVIAKHDALCVAGAPAAAVQLRRMHDTARRQQRTFWVMLGTGAAIALASAVVTDPFGSRGGNIAFGAGLTLAALSFIPASRRVNTLERYGREPPMLFGTSTFARYNEQLRRQLDARR